MKNFYENIIPVVGVLSIFFMLICLVIAMWTGSTFTLKLAATFFVVFCFCYLLGKAKSEE